MSVNTNLWAGTMGSNSAGRVTSPAFWSSVPGIITAMAAFITAVGGAAAIFFHREEGRVVGPPGEPLRQFSQRAVVERESYKVRDDDFVMTLQIKEIKARKRVLRVVFSAPGIPDKNAQLKEGESPIVMLGARQYSLQVHDFRSLKGNDVAIISLAKV